MVIDDVDRETGDLVVGGGGGGGGGGGDGSGGLDAGCEVGTQLCRAVCLARGWIAGDDDQLFSKIPVVSEGA